MRTWHRTIDKKQKNFTRGRHVFECERDRDRDRQREGYRKSKDRKKFKKSKKVKLKGVFSIEMERYLIMCLRLLTIVWVFFDGA